MQNLEARLNCRLFDRLGRSILPTAEAEVLYPRAIAILEDLQRLREEISATGKNIAGTLILGAGTIPGAYILPGLAAAFKKDFPEISFEIRIDDSATIVQAIAANELLLGIVGAKIASPKVRFQLFAEDTLVLAAAKDNPVATDISLDELTQLPFIVRERGSGTRKSTEALLARQQHSLEKLNICATLGSSAAVKEAIKADLGISILSRYAIADELASGTIKEIHIPGLLMTRSFYIVTPTK